LVYHWKGFARTIFPFREELEAAAYMNVVESIYYYFFLGMATQWKKVYPGVVGIILK